MIDGVEGVDAKGIVAVGIDEVGVERHPAGELRRFEGVAHDVEVDVVGALGVGRGVAGQQEHQRTGRLVVGIEVVGAVELERGAVIDDAFAVHLDHAQRLLVESAVLADVGQQLGEVDVELGHPVGAVEAVCADGDGDAIAPQRIIPAVAGGRGARGPRPQRGGDEQKYSEECHTY